MTGPAGEQPDSEPGPEDPDLQPAQQSSRAATDWARRRRLAEVFGDELPQTTSDEREPGERRPGRDDPGEAWLKAQVPPHHG